MNRMLALSVVPLLLVPPFVGGADPDEYAVLDQEAEPFVSAFDAGLGKARLVMYVSPTCGGCLLGARRIQEDVLESIGDGDLSVHVVWAPKNGGEEKHLDRVLDLVTDARATQYWDAERAIVEAYDARFPLAGPCAGIYLLYGPDARWGDDPVLWQDVHADQRGREDNPPLDTDAMRAAIRDLLG